MNESITFLSHHPERGKHTAILGDHISAVLRGHYPSDNPDQISGSIGFAQYRIGEIELQVDLSHLPYKEVSPFSKLYPAFVVEIIGIEDSFQQQGYAEKILFELEDIAQRQKQKLMAFQRVEGGEPIEKFLKKHGYREDSLSRWSNNRYKIL